MNPDTIDNPKPGQPVDNFGVSAETLSKTIYPPAPDHQAASPPPVPAGNSHHDGWRSIVSTLLLIIMAPVIALSIAAFVIQSYQVDGESMQTTLSHGDRLIVDKLPRSWSRITGHPYIPNRGDIIIFNQPAGGNSVSGSDKQLIKRVIALPGERVSIKSGKITVYNDSNPAGFNPDFKTGYSISSSFTPGNVDLVVPQNRVFVSGDNRQNSEDSRFFGPVPADKIVGKLVLRLLPFDKLQTF